MPVDFLFLGLGVVGGTISGWLGIGGGILMTPLLLYGPPLFGLGQLDMKEVTGLTMAQGFFAALSGSVVHNRHRSVSKKLVLSMGTSIVVGSSLGSILSKFVQGELLKGLFAGLALFASGLMFLPKEDVDRGEGPETVTFHKGLALFIPLILGFLLGMVGQAGAFILIPVMLYILKVPTRIAIGSSLGIVFLSASAGLLGKLITGQVPILPALNLALGASSGAWAGSHLSQWTAPRTLRLTLALIIALVAMWMWYELL